MQPRSINKFVFLLFIPIAGLSCDGVNSYQRDFLCECGPDQLDGKKITYTLSSEGDQITSANLVIDAETGKLRSTFAPIIDPSTSLPYTKEEIDRIHLGVTFGPSDLDCSIPPAFGGQTSGKADIAFLMDTTLSMGPAISGVQDSIESFAQGLTAEKLDVNYALVTFGDAYNTKKTTDSLFQLGTGADEPPSPPGAFDGYERPLLDFTSDFSSFKAFLDEVETVVGFGLGGGWTGENFYGVAVAMAGKPRSPELTVSSPPLTRRSDALFYEILIGNNCAHTEEYIDESPNKDPGKWLPPSREDRHALLGDGNVTIHSIYIEQPSLQLACDDPQQLTLKEIADTTGGETLIVPLEKDGRIDLRELSVDEYIKNFWFALVDASCVATDPNFDLNLTIRVKDSETAERTQIFHFSVQAE